MTKLTQEKLCFAKAIGATHFYDGDFWKNGDNGDIYYWNQYKTGWKSTKEDLSAMGTSWDDYKIDFSQPVNKEEEAPRPDMVNKPPHNKYMREIKPGVWVDVYDVIQAWKVTNSAQQHLIKKALQGGQRGHKDYETDMHDIIASATRAIELDHAAQALGK